MISTLDPRARRRLTELWGWAPAFRSAALPPWEASRPTPPTGQPERAPSASLFLEAERLGLRERERLRRAGGRA